MTNPEQTHLRMLVGGELVAGEAHFPIVNPATGAAFAKAPECSAQQLDKAVAAARHAFVAWAKVAIEDRAAALNRIAGQLRSHSDELSRLLTCEQGKPLAEAAAEIERAAVWLDRTASLRPPVVEGISDSGRPYVEIREPIGVVAAISPWNFPLQLSIWKLAPALLAGNTVVLKPSPYTPLAVLRMGEIIQHLVPPGVVNIISGTEMLGPMLSEHDGIDKISFTGSSVTGRAVMRSASARLKRVTLELGGNDPAIVLPDADVASVAEKLFWCAFRNAGQVCVAAKRIYIHDAIYDELRDALIALAAQHRPMAGEMAGATIGPVQNQKQYEIVKELIEDARSEGNIVIEPEFELPEQGYFIRPTIIDNPADSARIVNEEPFGPVVPLLRYHDVDEAIRRANSSDFGLGASVWGSDIDRAAEVAEKLNAGSVWINSGSNIEAGIPFAGHKQSGFGVENGLQGLLEYSHVKVIMR